MYLAELFEYVLLNSGQFLMGTETTEVNETRFLLLVKQVLAIYSKYCPIDKKFDMEVGSRRTHTFTAASLPYGIPEGITAVTPIRVFGVNPYFIKSISPIYQTNASEYLREKGQAPFQYNKPELTFPFSGTFKVHAYWKHSYIEETDDEGKAAFNFSTIDLEDSTFLEMLRGKFLISIGRSRRAFTLNEMPITMDAESLVSEGEDIYKTAFDDMLDKADKRYLALGGS